MSSHDQQLPPVSQRHLDAAVARHADYVNYRAQFAGASQAVGTTLLDPSPGFTTIDSDAPQADLKAELHAAQARSFDYAHYAAVGGVYDQHRGPGAPPARREFIVHYDGQLPHQHEGVKAEEAHHLGLIPVTFRVRHLLELGLRRSTSMAPALISAAGMLDRMHCGFTACP